MIYFLFDPYSDCVKVGYNKGGKSFKGRLSTLQTGNPNKLVLLGTCDGDMDYEHEIHAELHRWNVSGEWFRMSAKEVRDVVFELTGERGIAIYNKTVYNTPYIGYKLIKRDSYHMRLLSSSKGIIKQVSLKTDDIIKAEKLAAAIELRIKARSGAVRVGGVEEIPSYVKRLLRYNAI